MLRVLLFCLLAGCGAVEHARTNSLYPVATPESLAPPIVDPVVRDCSKAIHVRGFLPGALVQVWSNDFEEIGRAAPHFGDADIPLTRPLDVEDILTATQTVGGVTSAHSRIPVYVESWRGTPRAPTIDGPVWQCGRVVRLSGLEDSCRVEVLEDESLRAMAWSPGRDKGVVANTELRGRSSITAVQYACSLDVEEGGPRQRKSSDEAKAVRVSDFPDDFPPPSIDESSVQPGSDAVVIKDLYVGATVDVFVDGIPAGEGLATDAYTTIALQRPLEEGEVLTAEQMLCERSDASDPVTVEGELPLLEIVGPVCDDDPWVTVRHGALNATIAVLQGDTVVGTGGAQEGISRIGLSGLIPGLPITAVQYYGDAAVGDPSDEVRVCCCTEGCNADLMAIKEDDRELWADHRPASCARSKNKLFAVKDHPVLKLSIAADWAAVNGPTASAEAATVTSKGTSAEARVTPREDDRFADCDFRPLTITFDRLQTGNAFDGHRELELLTHCGSDDPEADERRVRMDYALHKALLAIDEAGLDVRLAEVMYIDPEGAELSRGLGFLRERDHEVCARCGWERAVDGPVPAADPEAPLTDEPVPADDPASAFGATLVSRFVSGTGGGEPISCVDAVGSTYSVPWDHDVGDIAIGADVRHRAFALDTFLSASLPAVGTRIQAWHITRNDARMREILREAPLDPIGRERLMSWYDLYMKTLKCFLGFK